MTRSRRPTRTPLIAGDGPLARVPPVAAFAAVVALFAAAVLVRGLVGALLLGLLALGIGGLLATTWQVLTASARAVRVLVLTVLVAVAVSMLVAP